MSPTKSPGFSEDEKAAMKAYAKELKATERMNKDRAEGEKAATPAGPTGLEGKISGQIYRIPLNQPGAIEEWMLKLNRRGWDDRHLSIFANMPGVKPRLFKLPKLQGAKSFEVIGVPLPGPGFYLVEMESQILGNALLGKPVPMFVPTSVLVTNMAVHFKRGLESSLVWVTTLDKGEPMAGAEVEIRDKNGESWFKGVTDRDGIARIANLPGPGIATGVPQGSL